MNRNWKFATGEFYHLYSRGVDKKEIFSDQYDFDRFVKFLYLANNSSPITLRNVPPDAFSLDKDDTLIDIGAYCLMPNHFHILVREHTEGGISKFMSKLLTSHSTFFNNKYKRSGTLFDGRFKARHADTDEYLKYLFAYIHLNPVKLIDSKWKENGIKDIRKTKEHLSKYNNSSYPDYLDSTSTSRKESKILNKSAFPDYFENVKDFNSLTNDWLKYKDI